MFAVSLDATAAPDAVKSTVEYVARLTAATKKELTAPADVQKASTTLDDWLGGK